MKKCMFHTISCLLAMTLQNLPVLLTLLVAPFPIGDICLRKGLSMLRNA